MVFLGIVLLQIFYSTLWPLCPGDGGDCWVHHGKPRQPGPLPDGGELQQGALLRSELFAAKIVLNYGFSSYDSMLHQTLLNPI